MSEPQSHRISLTLLGNAIDFMEEAAVRAEHRSPRDWKYAILHLVAGIELLLKERLRREHWTLVFADPDRASKSSLASGDFTSVGFDVAVKRLGGAAEVAIDETQLKRLKDLQKYRNRFQHFAADITRDQLCAAMASGFNFFLDFVQSNLGNELDKKSREAISDIAKKLDAFKDFVEHRFAAIEGKLKTAKVVINCPRCTQDTLMLGKGRPLCAFCGYCDDPDNVIFENGLDGLLGYCSTCLDMICIEYGDDFVCLGCGKFHSQ